MDYAPDRSLQPSPLSIASSVVMHGAGRLNSSLGVRLVEINSNMVMEQITKELTCDSTNNTERGQLSSAMYWV